MGGVKLTRESILDGTLHASVRAVLGPNVRFMTDAERAAQVAAILARAPRPGRVWVFAERSASHFPLLPRRSTIWPCK